MKYMNTVCGESAEFFIVKSGCIYRNHFYFKSICINSSHDTKFPKPLSFFSASFKFCYIFQLYQLSIVKEPLVPPNIICRN